MFVCIGMEYVIQIIFHDLIKITEKENEKKHQTFKNICTSYRDVSS